MASAASGSATAVGISNSEIAPLRSRIPMMTVVELKGFIRDLGSQCGARLHISGTKPTLINRIDEQLASWQHASNWDALRKAMTLVNHPRDARGILLQVGGSSTSNGSGGWASSSSNQNGYHGASSYSTQGRSGIPLGKLNPANTYRANASAGGASSASAWQTGVPKNICFKPSPFFTVVTMLTETILLLEADTTRKTATIDLRLTPEQTSLIRNDAARYQARLFCAQKSAAEISEKIAGTPAFIDFPGSCELRINNSVYTSSLKGSKSKPGRVPPPNLNKDKTLITRDGVNNKIELVYTNAPYKYVMVIGLCKYTPPETIVAKLKSEKSRSREEIIGTMKRAAAEDDIEIGTATLSLKDPLSYTRITEPCRSVHCSHSQCFDALYFFLSNEQSPTWNCPHCSKILKPEDLFIDGYFAHILSTVSEEEDAVIVEADGSWKTRDGKFSSSAATIPAAPTASLALPNGDGASQSIEAGSTAASANPSVESVVPPGAEVVLLDDTPSPPGSPPPRCVSSNGLVTRIEPATSAPRPSNASFSATAASTASNVIDLTESDDEDVPLAPTHPVSSAPIQLQQGHTQSATSTLPSLADSSSGSSVPAVSNHGGANLQRYLTSSTAATQGAAPNSTIRPYQQLSAPSSLQRQSALITPGGSAVSPSLPEARLSGSAGPGTPSSRTIMPHHSWPSEWGDSQPRIVSSTGGMREIRPVAPFSRPVPVPASAFSSPRLGSASAPPIALVTEQRALEAAEVSPLYPPQLPSRSASATALSPASSSNTRDSVFWPASYRPLEQPQPSPAPISPAPLPSASASKTRGRGESSDVADGREATPKRQRQEDLNDSGADASPPSSTTRSGRPTKAAGSLREASTPLPSVTPSPPPMMSGRTSNRAGNSHTTEEAEPSEQGDAQENPDYEDEEDAPPTRPGRNNGRTAVTSNAAAQEDSPVYTSASEEVDSSPGSSKKGNGGENGTRNVNGSGNFNVNANGNGHARSNGSSGGRRADSFDYDELMDDQDDSGEWEL